MGSQKRDKKAILHDQEAIEKLNFLSPLYDNASPEEVIIEAVNLLWETRYQQVKARLSELSSLHTDNG